MKYFLFLISLFLWNIAVSQTTETPEQIRAQMAKIRQTTNWDDPAAAKKANVEIKELAKKLMSGNNTMGGVASQQQTSDASSKDNQKISEINQAMANHKMDVYSQIWKAAAGGRGGDILLAEPLREEIKQEFQNEEAGTGGNDLTREETTMLYLDMSSKTSKLIIDQMENYKAINTLIITGGKNGAPVNLNDLFSKAKMYPLEVLYIINFKQHVKTIPESILNFKKLTELGLFNNSIEKLPASISSLTSLKILYVDINPISTLTPAINTLTSLDTLGVAKTNIGEAELDKIIMSLPNCIMLEE
jgi:hypothetical protein